MFHYSNKSILNNSRIMPGLLSGNSTYMLPRRPFYSHIKPLSYNIESNNKLTKFRISVKRKYSKTICNSNVKFNFIKIIKCFIVALYISILAKTQSL